MASTSGDRFTVSIGGDATGPVVVGHENTVETGPQQPAAPSTDTTADAPPADGSPEPAASQTNTADGHSNLFTVMEGDIHIHHDGPSASEED
ncbi:hypothetical protein [Streptomyces sp. NPDC097981]|uniref:hypothetical protein n=1 Tax=Streptomyces sp. NPDC097981 TaxID=3155428 RepID=UPI003332C310